MKKSSKLSSLAVALIFATFLILSISCASEPSSVSVKIKTLQSWLIGQEKSVPCSHEKSIIQWKYLVRELSKVGELNGIQLSEGGGMTSMNLESVITISKIPLNVVYSFRNTNGQVTLQVVSVTEVDSTNSPFSVTVYESELANYKTSVTEKIGKMLEEKANQLVEKSVYLE